MRGVLAQMQHFVYRCHCWILLWAVAWDAE